MKKLLALVLVLGLTSLASADLIFTVNGEPQPAIIQLKPSETIELDLELSTGENILGYDLTYRLSNPLAELVTGQIVFPAMFDLQGSLVGTPTPQSVRMSATQLFSSALVGPQDLMHSLILHCLGEGSVLLEIVVSGTTVVDGETLPLGSVLHTLEIKQIPEPVTIALLGLGSLFLRKRS